MNTYKPINPNFPPVVKNLIIINVLAWIASITLPRFGIDLVDWLGLHYWESEQFNLIQLVSYMFLHDTSSISHLFFNMFGVWMFGKNIEMYWGPKKFLIFYLVLNK
jgi:membrane associated rhomboid family serine protease